jgi:adenosylmethionine-8-amino-7-oxononanoate aminotransferase
MAGTRHAVAVGATLTPDDVDAFAVRDQLLEQGVITRAVNATTLTWCPPLVITDDEIDRIVDTVAKAVCR